MKKLLLVCCILLGTLVLQAQSSPVKWTYSAQKKGAGTYEVKLTAQISDGWHLYSQSTPEGGPLPTKIAFSKNPLAQLDGGVKEQGKLEQKYEEVFEVDTKYYSNKVEFVQLVKVKGKAKTALSGTVEFMVCNNQQCLPPAVQKFSVPLR